MEIHRFEKAWLAVGLVLIVGFIATVAYGAAGAGVTMLGDDGQVDAAALGDHPRFGQPGVYESDDGYDVYIVSQQFIYRPGSGNEPPVVPADTNVTFYVTSADVIHGFAIPGTNINAMAIPGQISEMKVRFDEPGTYGIVCHEYCGAGHHDMEGRIEVVPQSQFNESGVVNA
jgi:cytochrome c oxidase subunit 2